MSRLKIWTLAGTLVVGAGCSTATSSERSPAGDAAGGSGGSGGAGGGGVHAPLPCGIDCSRIVAPQCFVAVCDEAARQCTLVPTVGSEPCDDKDACTVGERCSEGVCHGGAPNDCGITPDACHVVACSEAGGAASCLLQPRADGSPCMTEDRCLLNATCEGGACVGARRDCFFFPVPDACHVGECNPATGQCEAVAGNEGAPCSDSGDLCMIGKSCRGGRCDGGAPKDCGTLDVGCNLGVCDPGSGSCYAEPIAVGAACVPGTDECNRGVCNDRGACESIPTTGVSCPSETVGCTVGICSELGVCTPRPVPDGGACVDNDPCTLGETCLAGVCQGGRPATAPAIYFAEGFEDNAAAWELGPTWQIGAAMSSSGQTYGHPDPAVDHTSTDDNGVAGVVIGDNVPLGLHPTYYLTSPVIDLGVPGSAYLTFWRFLNSDEGPAMTNRVEVWTGFRWAVLFESGGYPGIRDAAWTKVTLDLTPYKNAGLRVRFGYGIHREAFVDTVSGWNLDDVAIVSAVCP